MSTTTSGPWIWSSLAEPTLMLDEGKVRRNLGRMAEKFARLGIRLRPHGKTHQSAEVAGWAREQGAGGLTVSSLAMARYFADRGFDDLTLAMPFPPQQAPALAALSQRVQLQVLVDHPGCLPALSAALPRGLAVWIKVDSGLGRVGIPWDAPEEVGVLAGAIERTPHLGLAGLLTHAGQTYQAEDAAQVRALEAESLARLNAVREALERRGRAGLALSTGDTPGCSLADSFPGVAEVRPGNYVFYDLMQWRLGACALADIAVGVACPVLGQYPARRQIALHCGAVHLSRESLVVDGGKRVFGLLALPEGESFRPVEGAWVTALSQEHGLLTVDDPALFRALTPGRIAVILPVHACLTANGFPAYLTPRGRRIDKICSHYDPGGSAP